MQLRSHSNEDKCVFAINMVFGACTDMVVLRPTLPAKTLFWSVCVTKRENAQDRDERYQCKLKMQMKWQILIQREGVS